MNDIDVRLACADIASGCLSMGESAMEATENLYDFVIGGSVCEHGSDEDWDKWDTGYDAGMESAAELIEGEIVTLEEHGLAEYDRGYIGGLQSAREIILAEMEHERVREAEERDA